VVGEGSLDEQTLHGKAPAGVAVRARAAGARVIAVCGRCLVDRSALQAAGIEQAYALSDHEPDPEASMRNAATLLEHLGQRLAADGVLI
jgi:glycerate kinase